MWSSWCSLAGRVSPLALVVRGVALLLLLGMMGACNGDGDGNSGPALNVGFGLKQLQFTWTAVAEADFYRLLEDPDGVSGFTQVGANIPSGTTSQTLDIGVHRQDWVNARYRLEACNTAGCTTTNSVSTLAGMLQTIGYVKASNTGGNDNFGLSVALSGDGNTLAVGAPFEDSSTTGINSTPDLFADDAGAVYVYTRSGAGVWSQQAYVKASNTGGNDNFGLSVALSGDGNTLAVGAPFEDSITTGINSAPDENATNAGAVYVFIRSGIVWSQQAYVKASIAGIGDEFGTSVALSNDGTTLGVGARFEDSSTTGINSTPDENATNAGAVYVFIRSGIVWSQQAYVKASIAGIGDEFGTSVALSNDGTTLGVGAPFENSSTTGINSTPDLFADDAGAVYVYTRSGIVWSQQAYVKASNTGGNDHFGTSVALSSDGTTLGVGAPFENSSTTGINSTPDLFADDAGAVYVYTRSGIVWSQQAYVKASNTGGNDHFGTSVALSSDGTTLGVGAPFENSSTTGINSTPDLFADDAGAVYVYTRSGIVWSQQAYVKASNTGGNDHFGTSVALSNDGTTLGVGAPFENSSTTGINSTSDEFADNSGAVYLY